MKKNHQAIYALKAWREIVIATPTHIREKIRHLVETNAPQFVDEFYETLLMDDQAKVFLEHEVVRKRLHLSLQQWLLSLFMLVDDELFLVFAARQIEIGEVHSRIKLPSYLMGIGIRTLRNSFKKQLDKEGLNTEELSLAQLYISDLFALSDGLITSAYIRDMQGNTRADEAYRTVAVKHDVNLERERQRAALLEWENKLLFSFRFRSSPTKNLQLSDSEFGMWMNHKAKVFFEDMPDVSIVFEVIEHIDSVILPQLNQATLTDTEAMRRFEELKSKLDLIRYLTSDLFERLGSMDQGRDATTGLYNRRHLGAVLARELEQHTDKQQSFGVILIKIDNMDIAASLDESKYILLQQFSTLIIEFARAGDHVFRYGNAEFLILAVETTAELTQQLAEDLRKRILAHLFFVRSNPAVLLTASIGVVQYDGHPDYMVLLRNAENLIIKASIHGGNVVAIAGVDD
ncbi:MAG: GGDEF domain-containing protein [Methylococcaceae bacterium]